MRHGEVEAPWVGSFIGTKDVGLSDLGRHQAEAIAKYLEDAHVDAIVSSPRKRALDTAAPLARSKGLKLDIRKHLGEMDFGAWEGLNWAAIQQRDPEFAGTWSADPAKVPCPNGESCDLFFERCSNEIAKIVEEYKGRTVVFSGHAGVNRCIIGNILKRPYLDCFAFAQDYGCLNAAGWGENGFGQIALLNFVPGPRAKHQGDSVE
jgi:ribonuclease H / adenosylcobalamin/alpha-ribazole phosphatase